MANSREFTQSNLYSLVATALQPWGLRFSGYRVLFLVISRKIVTISWDHNKTGYCFGSHISLSFSWHGTVNLRQFIAILQAVFLVLFRLSKTFQCANWVKVGHQTVALWYRSVYSLEVSEDLARRKQELEDDSTLEIRLSRARVMPQLLNTHTCAGEPNYTSSVVWSHKGFTFTL